MTPIEFLERMSRHYAKRHESDEARIEWTQDMLAIIGTSNKRVLVKTFELIRDEYEERAFPQPALLRKYITRAAEMVSGPPSHDGYRHQGPSQRAPDSPQEIAATMKAREWQTEVIAKYKTWANWWTAHKHNYRDSSDRPPMKEFEIKAPPIANREHFEKLPRWNAGKLSDVTKRITGERD